VGAKVILQRTIAGVLYLWGILFASYVGMTVLKEKILYFTEQGYLVCFIGICIPIGIATFLLVLSMQEAEKRFRLMKVSVLTLFIVYDVLLINILFRGFRQFHAVHTVSMKEYFNWSVNYIPFKTIGNYVQSIFNHSNSKSIIVENLLGNLLLFAPMGILLPCIFQRFRNFKIIAIIMFLVLVCIEIAQFLTQTGRSDIDDVILNFIGVIMLYCLWNLKIIQKMLRKIYVLK
jgi:glycopeptide antibiotics resistance protein